MFGQVLKYYVWHSPYAGHTSINIIPETWGWQHPALGQFSTSESWTSFQNQRETEWSKYSGDVVIRGPASVCSKKTKACVKFHF